MPQRKKGFKEEFARFFEEPTRDRLRELLQHHTGERNDYDFKSEWPERSSLARHVLAIANYGGGCVVAGVEESDKGLEPKGVQKPFDPAELSGAVEKFLPTPLRATVELLDFKYDAAEYSRIQGRRFQVLIVQSDAAELPYVCGADGDGARKAAIYVRRGTNSVEANYEELQQLINRRLETGFSSSRRLNLEGHLKELKSLYAQIPESFFFHVSDLLRAADKMSQKNPDYPEESFAAFVRALIDAKKKLIRQLVSRDP